MNKSKLIIYREEWAGNLIIHSSEHHIELNHDDERKLLQELLSDQICKDLIEEMKYCECNFAMITRDEETQKAYCMECKKEIKE